MPFRADLERLIRERGLARFGIFHASGEGQFLPDGSENRISDFTTNLIKRFLAQYTQSFALEHIDPAFRRRFAVAKAEFNYETRAWATRHYELPCVEGDFVLLTPKDILTKDEAWINRP